MINIFVVAVKFDFEGLICLLSCRQTIRILLFEKILEKAKIEKFLLNFDCKMYLDIFKTKPFGFEKISFALKNTRN